MKKWQCTLILCSALVSRRGYDRRINAHHRGTEWDWEDEEGKYDVGDGWSDRLWVPSSLQPFAKMSDVTWDKEEGKDRILSTVTAAQIVILFFLPHWFINCSPLYRFTVVSQCQYMAPKFYFYFCGGLRLEVLVSSSSHGESQGKTRLSLTTMVSPRPHEQVSININKAYR